MEVLTPKRGEVWWVKFDPTIGGEINKTRPAIVISNNSANRVLNRIQVIPLTSTTAPVYPSETLVEVKKQKCKAMADQLKTVSKQRLTHIIGTISDADMLAVEFIIKLQLGIK